MTLAIRTARRYFDTEGSGIQACRELRFLVINDQLQLFVDQALVASAHDRDIARGQYGLATYRAAATWDNFAVLQP